MTLPLSFNFKPAHSIPVRTGSRYIEGRYLIVRFVARTFLTFDIFSVPMANVETSPGLIRCRWSKWEFRHRPDCTSFTWKLKVMACATHLLSGGSPETWLLLHYLLTWLQNKANSTGDDEGNLFLHCDFLIKSVSLTYLRYACGWCVRD